MIERLTSLVVVACLWAGSPVLLQSQTIDFSGYRGDFTIFYDSDEDAWDAAFRERPADGTEATGLETQADQDRFGADPNDWAYDVLNVHIVDPEIVTIDGTDYFASYRGDFGSGRPDFGVRPRLDEDQFDGFTMILDWGASSGPGEFGMVGADTFGSIVAYETAADNLTFDWDAWGHTHWHWGFSEPGEYELVFNLQTDLPDDGGVSSVGAETINFNVVPEPAAVAFLVGLGAAAFVLCRRKRGKS